VPELPEVEALARELAARAGGQRVTACQLASFSALKTFDPPLDSLVGREVSGCTRRGKHLCVDLEGRFLVMHLARAGFVQWREQQSPSPARMGRGPLALRVRLERGGFDVTEAGTEKRLALHVVDDLLAVPGIARLGPDPLEEGFDAARLGELLRASTGTVKTVLTDQSVLAGVGNAYSDEILFEARLLPLRRRASLKPVEEEALFAAIPAVLKRAVEAILANPNYEESKQDRSFMNVHMKGGKTCPRCGHRISQLGSNREPVNFCRGCQL
jgi:formamidopyrimidine-DNA glycosylase